MSTRTLAKGITWVGVLDFDRQVFDELMPLPYGTTYNCYLVKGSEKTALIDTVDFPFTNDLLANLQQLGVDKIDYVIANHAEQDHSGSIPQILQKYPAAQIVCTEKCKELLQSLLPLASAPFITVADGETLSLGGRTLEFVHFPWVHWPETMLTYVAQDKILFPCDLFGAHMASHDMLEPQKSQQLEMAKLYYAQIMMPFAAMIKKNLAKIEGREIQMIAPSHGPFYKKPQTIIDAYRHWLEGPLKNRVLLPYVSMHGSTRQMGDHLANALIQQGIHVQTYNMGSGRLEKFTASLVDAGTLIFGSSNVTTGLHPKIIAMAYLVSLLRPRTKYVSLIGSYGWAGGKMTEQLKSILGNFKAEWLPPVLTQGHPNAEACANLEQLANIIAEKHRAL